MGDLVGLVGLVNLVGLGELVALVGLGEWCKKEARVVALASYY